MQKRAQGKTRVAWLEEQCRVWDKANPDHTCWQVQILDGEKSIRVFSEDPFHLSPAPVFREELHEGEGERVTIRVIPQITQDKGWTRLPGIFLDVDPK